ncbi:MAG: hypothetical protein HOY71_55315, partial [Nonomuraea sp.]|nr:hypothetical protein [Nonomuraea sp.]
MQSWLVVDAKHHPLAFMLKLTSPSMMVNGYPVVGRWGENPVALPPGQHRFHMHVDYIGQMGAVDQDIWLRPGETVRLEYRAPLWMWLRGALGP